MRGMQVRRLAVVFAAALVLLGFGLFSEAPPQLAASDMGDISAGGMHTCVLTPSGGVQCWGRNHFGQLGDGTRDDSSIPVDVVGLESGVIAVAAGDLHTCALTAAGSVQCWGDNRYGQLGDGTTVNSSIPLDVVGLMSGVIAVAAGGLHSCAVTAEGAAMCWGLNNYGQLGVPVSDECACSETPVTVTGLDTGVAAVSAGVFHTCALTTSGGVKCWGLGDSGQAEPAQVEGLESGVMAVSAGDGHNCVLTTEGGVKCWGLNLYGKLGDGTIDYSAVPVDVVGLGTGVLTVSAAAGHTCALVADGSARCWGNNFFGQLGDGNSGPGSNQTTPVDIIHVENDVAAISAGGLHTCALTTAGAVVCWGMNTYGQLGLGDVNGDSFVNSIDATLVLQFDAGILESLEHPELADVNADSSVNSLDAQLVLQYDAGLVQNLN